jgi:predicted Zn-dependent protease with MMP-like domain
MRISAERFEQLAFEVADQVLGALPPHLRAEAESVVLEVADAAGPEHGSEFAGDLLGLYEGVPLVDRHVDGAVLYPDRITLFQQPLQRLARTEVELRRQIRKTLVHELGHFFGFDEDELQARGWA